MRIITAISALALALSMSMGNAAAGGPTDAKAPAEPKPKKAEAKAPKAAPKRATLRRRMPRPETGVPSARTVRRILRNAARTLPFKRLQIRTSEVYYGNYRSFQRAAVIDTQKVFNAISHYREIKRLGLNKNSGRYWVLIQRSNRVFHRALRKIAKDKGYQLIGAKGAIVIDGKDPDDLTAAVIGLFPKARS